MGRRRAGWPARGRRPRRPERPPVRRARHARGRRTRLRAALSPSGADRVGVHVDGEHLGRAERGAAMARMPVPVPMSSTRAGTRAPSARSSRIEAPLGAAVMAGAEGSAGLDDDADPPGPAIGPPTCRSPSAQGGTTTRRSPIARGGNDCLPGARPRLFEEGAHSGSPAASRESEVREGRPVVGEGPGEARRRRRFRIEGAGAPAVRPATPPPRRPGRPAPRGSS